MVQISITHMRYESDEEFAKRKSAELMFEKVYHYNAEHLERVERQVLAELKKKYEG